MQPFSGTGGQGQTPRAIENLKRKYAFKKIDLFY